MQQRQQCEQAGGKTADLAETQADINKQEQSGKQQRHKAFDKELSAHGRLEAVAAELHHFVIRQRLFEAIGELPLLVGVDVIGQRDADDGSIVHRVDDSLCGRAEHILRRLFHLLHIHRAGIAIAHQRTALEGDIHLGAENDVQHQRYSQNGQRNAHIQLSVSRKVDRFFHVFDSLLAEYGNRRVISQSFFHRTARACGGTSSGRPNAASRGKPTYP